MGVSGALRIKEKEKNEKEDRTELFALRVPNTLMHMIPKLQLDPTVDLRDGPLKWTALHMNV